jgi:hypothetical protein
MTDLANLLADCNAHGIRLLVAGNGGLTIDAAQDALTPNLLERLKTHKAELLALLRPTPEMTPAKSAKAVCRCGSTSWRDVPIHNGQSVRRDCSRCGRFIDFSIWYKNGT